jgi:hypothetical protein
MRQGANPGDKGQDLRPGEALFEDHLAVGVHSMKVNNVLGRVETQRSNLLHGGPSYGAPHQVGGTVGWVHSISL